MGVVGSSGFWIQPHSGKQRHLTEALEPLVPQQPECLGTHTFDLVEKTRAPCFNAKFNLTNQNLRVNMFNAELASDRWKRMDLQRRRDRETERRERIFNDKLRTMGVDTGALHVQVEEKKKREEKLEEKQKAHDAETLHNSKVAFILQRREEKNKRAVQIEVVNYRQQQQQPRSQQEFDLNDTDHSTDTGLMPPGLMGEDPEFKNRLQRQQEQMRQWSNQQQSERATERNQQTLEKLLYDQKRVEMDNRALQLQSLEMERSRAEAVATKEFNLAKIEEKRRQQSYDDDNRGLDINPALGRWGVPGLCPGSDLRGPTETLEQVLQFQRKQIEEKKRIELENKREEEQHDCVRLASARSALLLERKQVKLSKQMRRDQESSNFQLAELHRQQKLDLERGSVHESFFSKFNTCSR
ncbi:RIB43A-like with coiled-coils protein 2 [Platichthys flesus]|uniref:RIB43A-like with coiled-coils protein 2 n=1 Tax=Platichthys flesus TaxID=8260 RepID=UPI002DBDE27D|nr:RIB43A-like with coiled-coils protein 2 [Platichthys flesus]